MELEMKHRDYMTTLLKILKTLDGGPASVREILAENGAKRVGEVNNHAQYRSIVDECLATISDYDTFDDNLPEDPDKKPKSGKTGRRMKVVGGDGDFNEVVADYKAPDPFATAARARRVWPRETLTIALKAFYRVDDESQFNQMQYDRMRDVLDALREAGGGDREALTAEVALLTETLREANDELAKNKETVSKLRLRTAERDASAARAVGRLAK